ncbi:MAG: alpha-hydroxy-acid oxidizing protein [Verrucomicrobia bacterium]|nr:alpha-hydroxy-acid oxidizing protein [Verrucomicrobiota bacterium]
MSKESVRETKKFHSDPTTRSFQTGHQIGIYRRGPRNDADVIPFAVEALEAKARQRLSPEAYDWVSGVAGGGQTARANLSAFERWRIIPRMLCDISERDFGVEVLGQRWPMPYAIAPIGVQAGSHREGEKATARAAASLGIPMIVSTVSTFTLEEVAEASGSGRRWFQLYWPKRDDLTRSLLRRAEEAGYEAIVVTLDTQSLGWRESNLQLAHLPFLSGTGLANYFSDPVFRSMLAKSPEDDLDAAVEKYLEVFSELSRTWESISFIKENTSLPVLVKGVQHPDDALRAQDQGIDGIVVSNHGGRQTDGSVSTLEMLPSIVDAVEENVPVLFDSGIRRGCDAFKAIALGARAVLIGRPFMWALAVGGERGVQELMRTALQN